MRAFQVRFLISGDGWEDKGVHTCEEHGVQALQARFRQEADGYWGQHHRFVNQVDIMEVQSPDDPFVAYLTSLGLDVRRTHFPGPGRHAVPLDLVTPVPDALDRLAERFGRWEAWRDNGSLYQQFAVPDVGEDCFVAIETRRDEIPQIWLKNNVDARFFPFRY